MNNAYRKLMEQQKLSEQAKSAFYEKLGTAKPPKKRKVILKTAIIAACICLLIPISALAAENIFGISLAEFVARNMTQESAGEGYNTQYTNVYSFPLSDFSPELQSLTEDRSTGYDSWEALEAELGMDLITNSILSDAETVPYEQYVPEMNPNPDEPVLGSDLRPCTAHYFAKDGQLYLALVSAAYKRDGVRISLSATLTAEHPAFSQEDVAKLHTLEVTYPKADVEQFSQAQYTAESGLTATIMEIDRTASQSTLYEATFAANGASYKIQIDAEPGGNDANAKALLIEILEGFVF